MENLKSATNLLKSVMHTMDTISVSDWTIRINLSAALRQSNGLWRL